MSSKEEITVDCPKCEHRQEVMIWRSINVSLDSTLENDLFDDRINTFICSSCGHEGWIDIPLLYHDMNRQYAVIYYPFEFIDDHDFLVQFTAEGKLRMDVSPEMTKWTPGENYLEQSHVVFDMDEMKRYICFREKLHVSASTNQTEPK